ncbi:MAG: hypothetical protein K5656_12220 [Lachnospiraceae bacterium]|nr:hypothetical protein [Lachnospiraceae bacterium]
MDIIVYLSNTNIEVIEGTAKSKGVTASKIFSSTIPEGILLNGVITDAAGLVDVLKSMWEFNKLPTKGVRLVVNTPQISVRLIDVPLLSQSKTLEYLKREFAAGNGKSVGFFRVSEDSKNKVSKVCAEVADTNFIEEYRQVFSEAGIEVDEINSGIGVAVNLLNITMFAKGKNCVVMMRDGMTITSIFFVDGLYYYSTTTRTFNELGTEEFARELANSVNQIDQFAKSQKIEEPITHVYLTGMTENDTDYVGAVLVDTYSSDIHVQTLHQLVGVRITIPGYALDKLFYPVAGLSELHKSENILKMVKKELGGEKAKKREKIVSLAIPYVVVFFVMLVITVSFIVNNYKTSKKLKELEAYNTNVANRVAAQQYDENVHNAEVLAQHSTGLDLMEEFMNSYPTMTSQIIYDIEKVAKRLGDVSIYSYTASNGTLGINASFTDMDIVNEFIKQLSKQDYIEKVDYQGYTESEEGSDVWIAHVSCVLTEYAGNPDKKAASDDDANAADGEEVAE